MINGSCGLEAIAAWSRSPPHGVIALCEILGREVSPLYPSLSLLSHLYPGGRCVIPASFPYPHLPIPPPLMEPRKKPSAELAFRRFFFFKYQFPFVPRQRPIRAGGLPGLAKGWYCVSCSRRKGCPLAFLFDSIPCHSAADSELQLPLSAVDGDPLG